MHFAGFLQRRFTGPDNFRFSEPGNLTMDPSMHISVAHFFSLPGFWVGLALTVVFLAAAVRMRRYQGPI